MSKAIFILGNMEALSLAELQTVVSPEVQLVTSHVAMLDGADEKKYATWQNLLGGTVKIGTLLKRLPAKTQPAEILYQLVEYFVGLGQDKVYFAIGELGRDHLEPLDEGEIKTRLEENGLKARFAVHSRSGAGAALLSHRHHLIELLVINTPDAILLVRTHTVQDIDQWSRRDRAKPYADHKKGMLPPKLAREMINLARPRHGEVLYDPFCGTGTILLEAAMVGGLRLVGSDLDVRASLGTGENLDWLAKTYDLTLDYKVVTSDVTRVVAGQLGVEKVDLIVTEPFLGKQTPRDEQLPGIFRGLEKLYLGAFRRWTSLLNDGARLVVIFPRATDRRGQIYCLDSLLDKLTSLGYNKKSQGLMYAREHASVSREVCIFEWTGNKNRK